MELVGVTGRAGSGKTTFSDMLAQEAGVGAIHIDDILREIKLKYFRILMKENKDGEKTKVDSRLKKFLYSNKTLFGMFMRFRAALIEPILSEKIKELSAQNKRIILIDDIFLKYQKHYPRLTRVIIMERPFSQRRESIVKRDELTKEEVVIADIAHDMGNYRTCTTGKQTIKVQNDKSKEKLFELAHEIYMQYFSSIRERNRVVGNLRQPSIECCKSQQSILKPNTTIREDK